MSVNELIDSIRDKNVPFSVDAHLLWNTQQQSAVVRSWTARECADYIAEKLGLRAQYEPEGFLFRFEQ